MLRRFGASRKFVASSSPATSMMFATSSFTAKPSPSSSSSSFAATSNTAALFTPQRNVCDCALGPLLGHFATIGTACTSAPTFLFSPLGTIFFIVLAYNINYVGLKHLWYTIEFTFRDYVQDVALKQLLRYVVLITLMLTGNGLFCQA